MNTAFNMELKENDIIYEKYRLISRIGIGGMTEIWKAEILDSIRQEIQGSHYTAISFINAKFSSHSMAQKVFEHQFRIACLMKHPNIIKVYEYAVDEKKHLSFIVMELLEGKTLYQAFRDNSLHEYKKEKRFKLIKEIAQAINCVHQVGFVHSDIKPDNIFLLKNGKIKLYDFSISRKQHGFISQDIKLTEFDISSLGALTHSYASLEMLRGESADMADDVYSFALVVYYILTSEHAFEHLTAEQAASKKIQVKRIASLSKRQNEAIITALSFERTKRFKTIEEFWQVLKPRRFVFF